MTREKEDTASSAAERSPKSADLQKRKEQQNNQPWVLSFLQDFGPYALFYGIISIGWPFISENGRNLAVTVGTCVGFFLLSLPVYWLGRPFFVHLTPNKQDECLNRIVSIFFNLLAGAPAYACYYHLLPGIVPNFQEIAEGRTWVMDLFACVTTGYSLYDYPTLAKTYGRGALLIQLHHCVEMFIVSNYINTPVAAVYILGGGLMQLSSAMIHVERIMTIANISRHRGGLFSRLWRYALILNWAHMRLLVWPWAQWYCYQRHALTLLHFVIIVVGALFTVMNAQWLWKIVNVKSLQF